VADEKDRYLKALYGRPEIVVGPEDETAMPPGPMPVYLKVDFEEAREAEDWFGIQQDLGFVVSAATQVADIMERNWQETRGAESRPTADPDDIVKHSLWTTALITYARCFGSGVRACLDEGIFEDRDDVIEQHRYYKNIRDKHLAHSVNPFEVTTTGIAVIDYDGEEPYVFGATTLHATRSTENSSTVRYLATLAEWLQRHASRKRQEALQKVLRKGKELTREQIRQLRPLEVKPMQGYEAARIPRPPRPPAEGERW
jgi:hypothetical protein